MIGVVQETLLLCPCCSGQTDVLPCHIAHHRLRADDNRNNRDIAITFPAQLLSFRACFRAEIAQQSSASQFAWGKGTLNGLALLSIEKAYHASPLLCLEGIVRLAGVLCLWLCSVTSVLTFRYRIVSSCDQIET